MTSIFLLFLSSAILIWDMTLTIRVQTHPSAQVIIRNLDDEVPGLKISFVFTLVMLANFLLWLALPPWWRDWIPAVVLVLGLIHAYRNLAALRRLRASL